MTLLRNMALGVMPDVLRAADGPPLEAHDFLIRGTCCCEGLGMVSGIGLLGDFSDSGSGSWCTVPALSQCAEGRLACVVPEPGKVMLHTDTTRLPWPVGAVVTTISACSS